MILSQATLSNFYAQYLELAGDNMPCLLYCSFPQVGLARTSITLSFSLNTVVRYWRKRHWSNTIALSLKQITLGELDSLEPALAASTIGESPYISKHDSQEEENKGPQIRIIISVQITF